MTPEEIVKALRHEWYGPGGMPEYHNMIQTMRSAVSLIEQLQGERDRLQGVIERDRTKAAEIIGQIIGAVAPYRWLGEGRGSYAWDDDRYQDEFANCMTALNAALDPMRVLAADWSDCPKDFQGARIDWKARAEAAEQALAAEREKPRTIYDDRDRVNAATERQAGNLYVALKNLLDAVKERHHMRESIESVTINDAEQVLTSIAAAIRGE